MHKYWILTLLVGCGRVGYDELAERNASDPGATDDNQAVAAGLRFEAGPATRWPLSKTASAAVVVALDAESAATSTSASGAAATVTLSLEQDGAPLAGQTLFTGTLTQPIIDGAARFGDLVVGTLRQDLRLRASAFDDAGASLGALSTPFATVLNEGFSAASVHDLGWTVPWLSGNTFTALENGQLKFSPPGGGIAGYDGLSTPPFDFRGYQFTVELVSPQNTFPGGWGNECAMRISLSDTFYFGFNLDASSLAAGIYTGTRNASLERATFNATNHRFLRLRHAPDSAQVFWETSADGNTWAQMRVVPDQAVALEPVAASVSAGTYLNTPDPGHATFDNLMIEPVSQ